MADIAQYGDVFVPENHFFYECPQGHNPTSATALKRCPAAGCNTVLTRYGKGTRGRKGAK